MENITSQITSQNRNETSHNLMKRHTICSIFQHDVLCQKNVRSVKENDAARVSLLTSHCDVMKRHNDTDQAIEMIQLTRRVCH